MSRILSTSTLKIQDSPWKLRYPRSTAMTSSVSFDCHIVPSACHFLPRLVRCAPPPPPLFLSNVILRQHLKQHLWAIFRDTRPSLVPSPWAPAVATSAAIPCAMKTRPTECTIASKNQQLESPSLSAVERYSCPSTGSFSALWFFAKNRREREIMAQCVWHRVSAICTAYGREWEDPPVPPSICLEADRDALYFFFLLFFLLSFLRSLSANMTRGDTEPRVTWRVTSSRFILETPLASPPGSSPRSPVAGQITRVELELRDISGQMDG